MSDSGFYFTFGDATAEEDTAATSAATSLGSGFYFTIGGDAASDSASSGRVGCAAGSCPHPVEHPAEADWVQLASAVPVAGQLHRLKPRCEGMAYPTEDDFRSAVAAVRPETADDHSLERLREAWTGEVAGAMADWPDLMRSRLTDLSAAWAGTDFDAFAAQIEQARSLVDGVLDDIDATATELELREDAVYTLQGGDSGEIPYPAPLVGIEGEWSNLTAIHVRPAWWQGDCILMTCEEAEKALKLAGADPNLATEVREFIEERVGEGMSGLGTLVADVRTLVGEEAKEQFGSQVEAEFAAYTERQAAIDEDIAQKRGDQSTEFEQLSATGEEKPYPASADAAHMDLAEPEAEQPSAPVSPETTQDPSPTPPGGDGSSRDEEPEDETPWEGDEADEDASGGLASGGGFGTGGSAGIGGASGAGPGGGPSPVPQTASSSFTPTPTATVPTTSGSGGAGGSRTTMAPGAAQGAPGSKASTGSGDKGKGKGESGQDDGKQDLTRRESDNVWGYISPKDDPYV
ncbi:hypothetical protein [Glycomyces buryatensis]|uniref:Uncharacterized protein n=1 Tax=Glycomyces buryatensis TaxID=2570927 RepID=A0A4S8QJG2_9ACTN|nr:hypothetical protein [Glycomyces buryatensis]THV41519.1 hypothetical protein FAB82_10420 [Glycomyces buryatensis]